MRIWNHAVKSNVPQKQLPRHRDEIRHPAATAGSVTQPNIRNTTHSQSTLLETCKRKVCNLVHVTSQASGDRVSKSNDQQTQRNFAQGTGTSLKLTHRHMAIITQNSPLTMR